MVLCSRTLNLRNYSYLLWFVLTCTLFWIPSGAVFSQNQSQPYSQKTPTQSKILILSGENILPSSVRELTRGMQDYLNTAPFDHPSSRVVLELLGLDDFSANERPESLLELLHFRQKIHPASVVVSLTNSEDFLLNYGEELFPDIPKLYLIPNRSFRENIISQNLEDEYTIVGSVELIVQRTLEMIPMVLPDIRQLYIVSGVGEIDNEFRNYAISYFETSNSSLEINYLTGSPLSEIASSLSNLPMNSAVMALIYTMDNDGNRIDMMEYLRDIVRSSNAPVFAPYEGRYTDGVVGGSFTSWHMMGRRAGELAYFKANDIDPELLSDISSDYWFDRHQLQRWGISEKLLPANSIIEHSDPSVFELYPWQIVSMMLLVIALLFFAITFRRQAKDRGTQKTLFESVINSIPDAILMTDNNSKIFLVNKGAKDIFGFNQDEMLSMTTHSLIDKSKSDHSQIFNPGLQNIEPQIVGYRNSGNEGFFGETVGTQIVSARGEVLGHFALIRDVTKKLIVEKEQRQGQKMEALGNLIGGISHDFNNVLGVISGYAELLLTSKKPSPMENHLGKILKATSRGKALIQQIMTFSGDSSNEHIPINLAALLDETMKLIKVSIPTNIETSMKIDGDLLLVNGSEVQIQEIIMNLTTNAYQAMKSTGGEIRTSIRAESISGQRTLSHGILEPGDYCVLVVEDTGPGVSIEMCERVFEPFFTTKEPGQGSGMGLTIVYNLVKSHNAMLDFNSVLGMGTRASVYFREVSGTAVDTEDWGEPAIVKGGGQKILLVDDESGLLACTSQLLTAIGYEVYAFEDPNEALLCFKKSPHKFDILVSDEMMPGITGVQLLREIRKVSPSIPAIICTGYSEELNDVDVSKMGLNAIVRKPFSLEEISKTIACALSGQLNNQIINS